MVFYFPTQRKHGSPNETSQTFSWCNDEFDCMAAEITAARYQQTDIDAVIQKQQHLTIEQRKSLKRLLQQFPILFNGELGHYPHCKVSLDIDPNAKPSYKRAYPVAHAHLKVFWDKLDRLCKLGVLKKVGASWWGSPTFIIPKKDGTVRWVYDLQELNKVIKRRVYPLPRIADVLRKRSGYQFLTKLDISMQYYTFELDNQAKEFCTITTPFGNYQYQRMPMGCCQSSDVAQEVMESILSNLDDVQCYIDDVAVWSDTWDQHLQLLDVVLSWLQNNNFTINPLKCEWGVKKTDFLGHWLTPTGIKPRKKKVAGILKLDSPRNLTDVRSFIGTLNFYQDMYPKRSHILNPLHELTGLAKESKFEWLPKHQQAFNKMKALMAQDAYIRYPDHNLPFHVYTDARLATYNWARLSCKITNQ
jgi:Reverse transcriptase (RNA-dependent DNA polymerase)